MALDDLAEHLRAVNPGWDRPSLRPDAGGRRPARDAAESATRARTGSQPGSPRRRAASGCSDSLLLGAGYALGLVRAGEEQGTGRTVVQLTPLGRYVLALGPPPPPRPTFEHFLFVQPNLEIIAYRQGLSPQLVGRLSRFAWWTKIGAALELKLTQESIVLGLEGGQTPEQMIEILTRHSQRPLPPLVPTRSGGGPAAASGSLLHRRHPDRVRLARGARPGAGGLGRGRPQTFIPVADRFLLVESPQRIPTDRIRTSGSRDYRHPPEKCVSIEPDGVTLALDPTRSDLLVDAELSRFADELPTARNPARGRLRSRPSRRYVVSPASLARAAELGITPGPDRRLVPAPDRRAPLPGDPAAPPSPSAAPTALTARRMLVLITPTAELADGLLQHPATRDFLGDRLGPTAVAVPEDQLEKLQGVLEELGLEWSAS